LKTSDVRHTCSSSRIRRQTYTSNNSLVINIFIYFDYLCISEVVLNFITLN